MPEHATNAAPRETDLSKKCPCFFEVMTQADYARLIAAGGVDHLIYVGDTDAGEYVFWCLAPDSFTAEKAINNCRNCYASEDDLCADYVELAGTFEVEEADEAGNAVSVEYPRLKPGTWC